MASRLANLKRRLTWGDFPHRSTPPPGPNQTAIAAHTEARYSQFNWGFDPVPGGLRLTDNIVINVEFVRSSSWVADWVFRQPRQYQNDLLNHEQGHYAIVALMARDLFIDLMLLKSQIFRSAQSARQAVNALTQRYSTNAIQAISGKYDARTETNHGLVSAAQQRWDGYFNRAFTQPRTPASRSPDRVPHKVTLLEVLRSAGKYP